MALEKLSPTTLSFYAPRFEVQINNSRLAANISKAIIEVAIDEKMDEGASFRLTVNDEFDTTKQQFKWLDHPLFDVGNTISIKDRLRQRPAGDHDGGDHFVRETATYPASRSATLPCRPGK